MLIGAVVRSCKSNSTAKYLFKKWGVSQIVAPDFGR